MYLLQLGSASHEALCSLASVAALAPPQAYLLVLGSKSKSGVNLTDLYKSLEQKSNVILTGKAQSLLLTLTITCGEVILLFTSRFQ